MCIQRELPGLAFDRLRSSIIMKRNKSILLLTLIILNIIVVIWSINLYNENRALEKSHTQILQNISGGNANWRLEEAIEVVNDFSIYINLGQIEYSGVETRNLGDFQATLLKDSPEGNKIFTTESQYNRDLNSGDKLSLGTYKGKPFRREDLKNQKLFLKLSYSLDNKKYNESFLITGNYLELDNESQNN